MDSSRIKRLANFEKRAVFAPDSVYTHVAEGWRYIPIHQFSDEQELLNGIDVEPEDCVLVDAWCELNGDVTLLEVWTKEITSLPVGLYARREDDELKLTYLAAALDQLSITKNEFEEIISKFINLGFPDGPKFKNLDTKLRLIE